jgi:hypothetical protein
MAEGMTRRKQTVVRKSGHRGTKTLNRAAFGLVEEKATEITDLLLEATRNGHVMSTRLLIELAAGNLDAKQAAAMRPFRKLLQDLAAEGQFPAEALDAAEEAPTGNLRRPEGLKS